jgi:hypothetical protein
MLIALTSSARVQPLQSPQANAPQLSRQARLRQQTAQLNQLAAQLQQALDKSGTDKLSMDVVRTSQQIEALSREIEWELKNP